jgi:hypothetical protein
MSEITQEQSSINLNTLVHIHQNKLRSIQVENDLENQIIAESYVLTAQSRACLGRILLRLGDPTYGRSWTLTGPYGSGKSYFSLFLMNLACSNQSGHRHVIDQLTGIDPVLTQQAAEVLNLSASRGLLPLAITGFRASIQDCLKHGFARAIRQMENDEYFASATADLESWTTETDSRTITQWIRSFLSLITSTPFNYQGLLLIFDEMGKPLEFASTHPEEVDVYLLQELAEFANRSGEKPFVMIGILHQAFERYAAMLDQTTQREWAKVQGRFEDIAFQEPPTQQTRLLANAIDSIEQENINRTVPFLKRIAQETIEAGWCPALMKREEFLDICQVAYPFHPSVLVALPYLFKRLAQNERSIFAYLASFEPYGFQEFLRTHTPPDFLRLPDLFDYLTANFQARLYASNRARALTETLERLDNTPGLSALEIEILKTIGLLNWLGEVSSLQATEALLSSALVSDQFSYSNIRQALSSLKERSIIVFRQHNRTYAIWQGSDVDLDERMEQAQRQISGMFNLAEAVQRYLPPRPLVARRHSFQTGTLRFFEVRYVDSSLRDQISLLPKAGTSGLVLLCLAASPLEISKFTYWAEHSPLSDADGILIGITKRTSRLGELLYDLRCFHWIEENTPELRDDKVAQKELFTRINSIETLIQSELDRSVSLHRLTDSTGCVWKYKGQDLPLAAKEEISQILSRICDERYSSTPHIWNELINRRMLSSQSTAARRNLIGAMLTQSHLSQMGIEGYPPERSMYESLLVAGGLHQQIAPDRWQIHAPPADDPLKLQKVWEAISNYIFISPPQPRSVAELFNQLSSAPFGVTEGVLPVLLCAFLQAYQEETTLYREGTLLAEPSVPDWEVLLRRPELFSVAGCRVTGTRAAVVERIARGLGTLPNVMPIVRVLVRQLKSLPEYAWKTNTVSKEAIALRRAIEHAHSPEQLLFNDLPLALSLQAITGDWLDTEALESFFQRLNETLSELATATPCRRDWARDTFLEACELPTSPDGWQTFVDVAREMTAHVSHPNLVPLVKRAAEAADPAAALESAMALIANRPLHTWTDSDVERFPMLAQSFGQLFMAERNGYLPGLPLTKEEKLRSEKLTKTLQQQLEQYQDDPRILQAALQRLIELYKYDNSSHNK